MQRSGRTVLFALAAALALPSGAAAQQPGAVVAGPTPSGATLTAFDRGGQLCIEIRTPTGGSGPDCDPPPTSARQAAITAVGDPRAGVWYGVVSADVAAVELRFTHRRRVAAATSAGAAYHGRFAGRVRFFVVDGPGVRNEPYLERLLAADGHLLAAIQPPDAEFPVLRPPVTFARGRAGGATWEARAYVRRELRPTPLEPERFERVACVGVATAGRDGLRAETCADEGPLQAAVRPSFNGACRPVGLVVTGLVAPRVARVVAVLGDGSRRAAAIRALPAALAVDRRAFAIALDRDTALRRVIALDRTGRRVANVGFGLAPARLRCDPLPGLGFVSVIFGFGLIRGVDLAPPPGAPRLLVRDEGVRMCFSIGRFAPDGADCELPPVELSESRILRQTAGGRTLLAGLLPAQVAAVRVHFSGGAQQLVPTTPTVVGYTGRYVGSVRFLALDVPGARRVLSVDLLDASGALLLPFPGPDGTPARFRPVTVVRIGGVSVRAGALRDGIPCVAIAGGDCEFVLRGGISVTTPCVPRRIIVTSVLAPPTSGLEVQVADGRTIRARIVRIPARARVRGRLAVAVLPARARPVQLVLRRGRSQAPLRRALRLSPAASQCGYAGDLATGL